MSHLHRYSLLSLYRVNNKTKMHVQGSKRVQRGMGALYFQSAISLPAIFSIVAFFN